MPATGQYMPVMQQHSLIQAAEAIQFQAAYLGGLGHLGQMSQQAKASDIGAPGGAMLGQASAAAAALLCCMLLQAAMTHCDPWPCRAWQQP